MSLWLRHCYQHLHFSLLLEWAGQESSFIKPVGTQILLVLNWWDHHPQLVRCLGIENHGFSAISILILYTHFAEKWQGTYCILVFITNTHKMKHWLSQEAISEAWHHKLLQPWLKGPAQACQWVWVHHWLSSWLFTVKHYEPFMCQCHTIIFYVVSMVIAVLLYVIILCSMTH